MRQTNKLHHNQPKKRIYASLCVCVCVCLLFLCSISELLFFPPPQTFDFDFFRFAESVVLICNLKVLVVVGCSENGK